MDFVNKGCGRDEYLSFNFPSEAALLCIMTYDLFTQEAGCDNDTNNKYSGRVSGHSQHV